ncbi:50S ribosomal protein L29 [Candidatus Poribacteria bacterium]|jgi:large subunit ribosomal protein L29|nr:50S ribosomal protein L29 [Candidatus Poribacteria bacterium]MAP86218.1 50S ribosomal protein L29 [Candidatus Poribacteria bacterium]MBT21384.1 50S ribosomal protein L29 [Candidatus Poribacteria bacterium]MCS5608814.1 50S ribosomal protein L29 [Candidatus Poribacteria bacterium]MEC8841299.1 50S ribosomal protein L29 [Candidatus Poribacteria bacterium]|tara:strand:+ start:341 stop:541 length:201 start_codon:yes stop_codon:yes gene_type:complete
MNTAELRAKPTEELENDLQDLQESLFSLKFRNVLSQLDDTSQLKKVRRDVARTKTILRERSLGIER